MTLKTASVWLWEQVVGRRALQLFQIEDGTAYQLPTFLNVV